MGQPAKQSTATSAVSEKTVSQSAITDHVYKVFPNDLNANKTIFGGQIMAIADRLALVVAERHSSHMCVTASVDSVHFLAPVQENDTLIFRVAINRAWTTSMEIGVRVMAENSYTGDTRHVVSAYFTFVAVGADGQPMTVPAVKPESSDEAKRFEAAGVRREARLRVKQSLAQYQTH